jgi:hypothetical protein
MSMAAIKKGQHEVLKKCCLVTGNEYVKQAIRLVENDVLYWKKSCNVAVIPASYQCAL